MSFEDLYDCCFRNIGVLRLATSPKGFTSVLLIVSIVCSLNLITLFLQLYDTWNCKEVLLLLFNSKFDDSCCVSLWKWGSLTSVNLIKTTQFGVRRNALLCFVELSMALKVGGRMFELVVCIISSPVYFSLWCKMPINHCSLEINMYEVVGAINGVWFMLLSFEKKVAIIEWNMMWYVHGWV